VEILIALKLMLRLLRKLTTVARRSLALLLLIMETLLVRPKLIILAGLIIVLPILALRAPVASNKLIGESFLIHKVLLPVMGRRIIY
jgi:uncharacterized membrane protein